MKTEVCQKLPIRPSAGFSALFEVELTGTRNSTLEGPSNGVATNFEHAPFIVAYTFTFGGNFGGIPGFVAIAFQGLKYCDGPRRQRHVAGVPVFCGWWGGESAA